MGIWKVYSQHRNITMLTENGLQQNNLQTHKCPKTKSSQPHGKKEANKLNKQTHYITEARGRRRRPPLNSRGHFDLHSSRPIWADALKTVVTAPPSMKNQPSNLWYDIIIQKKKQHLQYDFSLFTEITQLQCSWLFSKSSFSLVSYPFESDNRARTSLSTKFDSTASSNGVLPSPFTARGSAPLQLDWKPISSVP